MYKWIVSLIDELRKNPTLKSKIIVFSYRMASVFFSKKKNPLKFLFIIFVLMYYFLVEFFWGVEIKPKTKIGWGVIIYHPVCIIINPGAVLGSGVILRHGVTIGNKYDRRSGIETNCPRIGDNVEFGAHACVLGDIEIGSDSIIGATAYVDFNVKQNTIIAATRGLILRTSA
ncbi:Serine acetyltransferase [Raoultella terrigena]|uniref:serine acetyltransferase n=1 Tax=Raoultella terrigena TaxID=577 RepID=UPI000DFCF45A|nr:serine acetyltransferase [Raoultella terrigena]SUQ57118.1 Serine acetyltransferase [Raoultella terrigena]